MRVHNLTAASVPGDWIRLFSPMQNFSEAMCLNFMYFSRYMDVKVFLYNQTDTELLLSITYDGQERSVLRACLVGHETPVQKFSCPNLNFIYPQQHFRTWHPASTNIPPGRFGVVFELTFSQFAIKNAGIDNVTLTSGLCESKGGSRHSHPKFLGHPHF